MASQRTLLDGNTGQKFDSLELLVGEAVNTSGLPDGTVEGQPLTWDPATGWQGGSSVVVDSVQATTDNLTVSAQGATGVVNVDGGDGTRVATGNGQIGMTVAGVAGSVAMSEGTPGVLQVDLTSALRLEFEDGGGVPSRAAFFGLPATPVGRQSITGATTQEQVDSIVAALVAFGLVTDDRVP